MFRTVPLSQGCLTSKDTDYATAQKLNLPTVFSTVTTTHVIFCNMQRSATLDYPQWSGSNSNRHSTFYVTSQTSTCTWLYVGSVNIQVLKLNEGEYRGIQHWPLPKQPFSVYSLGTGLCIGNPKKEKKRGLYACMLPITWITSFWCSYLKPLTPRAIKFPQTIANSKKVKGEHWDTSIHLSPSSNILMCSL